jgi:hypothetical protein
MNCDICEMPTDYYRPDDIVVSEIFAVNYARRICATPTEVEQVKACFCSGWEWHMLGTPNAEEAATKYAQWRHSWVDDYCLAKRDFIAGFEARATWCDGGKVRPSPVEPYVFPRLP